MPYATLAEIKTYLGIASVDADRDTLLTAALDAASARIDRMCGRTFTYAPSATTITYRTAGKTFMNGHGEYGLIVPDIGTATGLVVDGSPTYDTTALPITTLWSAAPWPAPTVSLTARFGWPEVPDEVVQACKILAARLYRRKDSPDGIAGSSEWGVIRVSREDPDVKSLLDPYMLPGMA